MNFFFENLSLVPETREVMEQFKLVFGSGTSDLAKIRPLKIWTSWISPWVPPYGILPLSSECLVSYDPHFPGNDGTKEQKHWILYQYQPISFMQRVQKPLSLSGQLYQLQED